LERRVQQRRDPDEERPAARRAPDRAAVHSVLGLQRSAGNQAVVRALSRGRRVLQRYFDNFVAEDDEEKGRKARFDAFVDRAIAAGIERDVAEGAGLETLQYWEGWSNHHASDFDWAYINGGKGFRSRLEARLEAEVKAGPLKALLDAIFAEKADPTVLRSLGEAAGLKPGKKQEKLELDPEQEAGFVEHYANKFDSRIAGHGLAFRAAWKRASETDKRRILDIIFGPDTGDEGYVPPTAHLSDMEYVIEGVTGITGTPPNVIESWARNPTGSLFDHVKALGQGYRTKYMSHEEREDYLLTIDGGTVTLPTGEPLQGDNIYVLSGDNEFYGGAKKSGRDGKQDTDAIHHSSFMAGLPVRGAGHFATSDAGALQRVDDVSGHYRPGDYELGLVLYHLEFYGTNLATVRVNRKDDRADRFLAEWKRAYLPEEKAEEIEGEEEVKSGQEATVKT
jgi:hypothetical protein